MFQAWTQFYYVLFQYLNPVSVWIESFKQEKIDQLQNAKQHVCMTLILPDDLKTDLDRGALVKISP